MKKTNTRALCALLALIMVLGLAAPAAAFGSATAGDDTAYGTVMAGTTIYKSYDTGSGSVGVITTGGTVKILKMVGDFYYIYVDEYFEGYVQKSSMYNVYGNIPTEKIPERVSVTTGTVRAGTPIYSAPSLSSSVIASTSNAGVITLEKKNGNFFLVKFSNVTGYIHNSYVTEIGNYGFLEDEVVDNYGQGATTGITDSNVYGIVANGATIYSSPSASSTPVGAVQGSGRIKLEAQSGSFYKITIGTTTGYVAASSVTNIEGSFHPITGLPGGSNLGYISNCQTDVNFRETPNGKKLGTLFKGTAVTVLSVSGNFYRVRVQATNQEGYVHKDYVTFSTTTGGTSGTVGGTPVAGGNTGTRTGTIGNCSSWVSLRQSPSASSTRLAKLNKGSTVTIYGTSGTYTQVSYNGTNGYVLSQYVNVSATTGGSTGTVGGTTGTTGSTGSASGGHVTGDVTLGTPVYSAPSSTSTKLGTVNGNGTIHLESLTNGFYKVTLSGTVGYIPANYVTNVQGSFSTTGSTGSTGTVGGTPVTGGSTNGTAGYIGNCDSWVSLRQSANSSSTRLAKLNKGSAITIYSVSGTYTYIDYNGTKGYVLSKYVMSGSPSTGTVGGSSGSTGTVGGTNTTGATSTYATGTAADSWGSFYMIEGTNIGSAYGQLYDNNIYCNGLNAKGTDYYYNAYSGKKNYFFSLGPKDTEISVIMGHNMRQSLTGMHYLHHIQNAWLNGNKCESCGKSCSTRTSTFYINYGGHSSWQLLGFCELNSSTMSSSSQRKEVKEYFVLNYGRTGASKVEWANTFLSYCNSSYKGAVLNSSVSASDDLMILVTCGDKGGDNYQTLYMLLKGM